ncbi:MAG: FHA domain-containing protein [Planctomycetes bacterium]|nr:FHA domain-containing protein [Planctomycetota bacterium]
MELARMAATTRGVVTDFLIRPDEAVTLGRSSSCTVPLRDPKVSRRHCQLSFAQGRVVAVDLASSHGLLHRGARAPMVALAVGDGFHLGETFVRFVAVDRLDDAAAAALFAPGGAHERRAAAGDDVADDEPERAPSEAAVAATAQSLLPPTPPAPPPGPVAAAVVFADEAPPAIPPSAAGAVRAAEASAVAPPTAATIAGGAGWDAFAASDRAPDVVRLPPSNRRAPMPTAPSAAKSFAARLAAEAIVSAMHLALVVVVLLLVKKAFGFDLYRAFGMGG